VAILATAGSIETDPDDDCHPKGQSVEPGPERSYCVVLDNDGHRAGHFSHSFLQQDVIFRQVCSGQTEASKVDLLPFETGA
jgi:hypothetical protein